MKRINLKLVLIVLAAVFLTGYFLYQGRGYLFGPQISLDFPSDGEVVHNSNLEVKGQALNVAFLSLNGRQILTDEHGLFNEGLLLAKGYNIIEIMATDKFGRVKKEKREIVLE